MHKYFVSYAYLMQPTNEDPHPRTEFANDTVEWDVPIRSIKDVQEIEEHLCERFIRLIQSLTILNWRQWEDP